MCEVAFFKAKALLLCSCDLAGAQATGADVHSDRGAVNDSLNALYVGLPHTVAAMMGMGLLDAENNALSADITLCHDKYLLYMNS